MEIFWIVVFAVMMVYVAWWLIYAIRARVAFEVEMGLGVGTLWVAIMAPRVFEGPSTLVDWPPALSLLGWAFVCLSVGLFVVAMLSLRRGGYATSGWENTTALTRIGIHGLVRHPMQLSGIVGACGVALAQPTLPVIVLAAASAACFALGVRAEDRFNVAKFGEPYRVYMAQVPALNLFAGIWAWLKAR
jgi:protein-S-isoprenylcysteine O-methyltransferase Ste14